MIAEKIATQLDIMAQAIEVGDAQSRDAAAEALSVCLEKVQALEANAKKAEAFDKLASMYARAGLDLNVGNAGPFASSVTGLFSATRSTLAKFSNGQ